MAPTYTAGFASDYRKERKLQKLVSNIEASGVPPWFTPTSWSNAHQHHGPAVFAVGVGYGYIKANYFVNTLRNTGYRGDVVLAMTKLEQDAPKDTKAEIIEEKEGDCI